MSPNRIVISPGPGSPKDAGISVDVVKTFSDKQVPILGVCLGHQCIGAAFGGKIESAGEIFHGKSSPVVHDGRGLLAGIASPFDAIRYHSLVISRDCFPQELEVTARTENSLIMGLRHRIYPIEGVQFHPESIMTEVGSKILKNFLGDATND